MFKKEKKEKNTKLQIFIPQMLLHVCISVNLDTMNYLSGISVNGCTQYLLRTTKGLFTLEHLNQVELNMGWTQDRPRMSLDFSTPCSTSHHFTLIHANQAYLATGQFQPRFKNLKPWQKQGWDQSRVHQSRGVDAGWCWVEHFQVWKAACFESCVNPTFV